MNNNRQIGVEGVGMETKYLRDRRIKPTPNAFEAAGLSSAEVEPIQSINSTDISYNITNTSLMIGNSTNTDDEEYGTSDIIWTCLGPLLMILLCVFSQRSTVPSSQYHRGEMIRRQAERVWAIQRAKDERQAIPTETRMLQIEESLCKMKVVSKCSRTGHCVLGPVEEEVQEETKTDDNEVLLTAAGEEKKTTSDESSTVTEDETVSPPTPNTDTVAASTPSGSKSASMKCPESPGRTERKPLLSANSEDSEDTFGSAEETLESSQSSTNNCPAKHDDSTCYDDFEDDEDVCPICLDSFEVGDIVMFSRHNHGSCSHVFHEECLLQWLLQQRENECPTCRACFIANATNSTTSSSSSTADTSENSILEVDETDSDFSDKETMRNESSGDIEEGNGNSASSNNTNDDINNGGDCAFDLDEMKDENHQFVDGENKTDTPKPDAIVDEMEERFTYIIVKGSVQRVPSS